MKRLSCFVLSMVTMCVFALGIATPAFAEGETDTTGAPAAEEVKTGWQKESGKWYYVDPSTKTKAIGWQKNIDGKSYYFDDNGVMQIGWQSLGDSYYYFNEGGAMQTDWFKVRKTWYYANSNGIMLTGWLKLSKKWYYLKESGAMATNWQKIDGKWYYFKKGGAMATGWQKIGKTWYWFHPSGVMADKATPVSGTMHNFKSSGAWTGKTSSDAFAKLAPTTRMSFSELVGDNGDYRSVTSFPNKNTYKVIVDLYHQVVLVYSKDSKGNYTVPVRYMITTTGGPKTPTPAGVYSAKNVRKRFSQFSTGEYAQYWTKVVGEIYFHSILYRSKNTSSLYTSSYKLLGRVGSHGCIRLLVPDARWIYQNIAPGTTIQIRTGSAGDKATAAIKRQLIRAAIP